MMTHIQEHPRDQEPVGDPLGEGGHRGADAQEPGGRHRPLGRPRRQGRDQGRQAPSADAGLIVDSVFL